MPSSPSVTIVIPVYNEARIIADTLKTLVDFFVASRFPYAYRIVVVDNASSDETSRIVGECAARLKEVSLIRLSEKGKGRAIRAGWDTGGDILAFMDADLSSDLSFFEALVSPIAKGTADLSIGSRLGPHSVLVSPKRGRKIASHTYNALARLLLGTQVMDHQCGFKVISVDAYRLLRPFLRDMGFFFDTELIARARQKSVRIAEVDIRWVDSPTSKVSLFSDSLMMFGSIVRLARLL